MPERDPSPDDPVEAAPSPFAPDAASAPRWKQGLFVSAAVHLLAITLLVVVPYQIYQASRGGHAQGPAGGSGRDAPPSAAPAKPAAKSLPDGSPVVPPDQAQRVFDRLLRENQSATPEERQRRLTEAAAELPKVTNPESLKRIGAQFEGWFGAAPRAAPKTSPPPPGSENSVQSLNRFDAASAQIHDVRIRRVPKPVEPPAAAASPAPTDGESAGQPKTASKPRAKKAPPQYEAVLVDARGESIVVPLSAEEGEPLHRIFSLVKSNPLLEQIYRDMAAPLLDKLLRDLPPAAVEPSPAK